MWFRWLRNLRILLEICGIDLCRMQEQRGINSYYCISSKLASIWFLIRKSTRSSSRKTKTKKRKVHWSQDDRRQLIVEGWSWSQKWASMIDLFCCLISTLCILRLSESSIFALPLLSGLLLNSSMASLCRLGLERMMCYCLIWTLQPASQCCRVFCKT